MSALQKNRFFFLLPFLFMAIRDEYNSLPLSGGECLSHPVDETRRTCACRCSGRPGCLGGLSRMTLRVNPMSAIALTISTSFACCCHSPIMPS